MYHDVKIFAGGRKVGDISNGSLQERTMKNKLVWQCRNMNNLGEELLFYQTMSQNTYLRRC